MGELSERFLSAYNRLHDVLRRRMKMDQFVGFREVIAEAEKRKFLPSSEVVKLKRISDLRNVIIHDVRFPEVSIAEPHEDITAEIEGILASVEKRNVLSIAAQSPRLFKPSDALREALREMSKKDFSQVIVQDDKQDVQLLTTDAIASWIESMHDEVIIELPTVTIADVLRYERTARFRVVSRSMSVSEAIAVFENAASWPDERLFALLVTHNGKSIEKCIGIVTPSDAFGNVAK